MFELYPHQKEVIVKLRNSWKHFRTHQIYLNVGGGKTAIAFHIIKSMNDKGLRVLFVAPYTTLINQTYDRFTEYGLSEPSVIWQDDERYDEKNLCHIASTDTLIRREFPQDIDLMIVDESHIKRKKLLDIIENSTFPVIGLSGTPFSNWMGDYYESLIKTVTMKQMIESGMLCGFEFYAPTKPDLTGVKTSNSAQYGIDYIEAQVSEIMNGADIVGDIVTNWLKYGDNLPTIAFCCNVLHANHVTNEFNRAGISAEVMTAKTPKDERRLIISRFEQGITKVICSVGTLIAGFDSDVRCIIYARPTKSEMRWLQCMGRGARTAKGKEVCKVFDHSGTVHRIGFPQDIEYERLKSVEEAEKNNSARKKEDEREKKPKECLNCNFMKPEGVYVCPKCGFKPIAGEDVEVDESRDIKLINGKKVITKEEMQVFYSGLLGHQSEQMNQGKNFTDKRVNALFKSKFKLWPNQANMSRQITPSTIEVKNFIKHENIKYAKGRSRAKQVLAELNGLFEDAAQ